MTYCGYVGILIVSIYILFIFLMIILFIIGVIILSNEGIILIRVKVFHVIFFSDFELIFGVWNFIFIFIVIFIRMTVIIFSFSYINSIAVSNFVFLYRSFIFSILWLTLNNNFYWIILGWDGLGVVSFLLIIFYINCERINNGLFTLFQNRIGDLFFVFFILGLLELRIITNLVLSFGILLLIIGRCVKRAQFPFNAWLLSAIRAPTPISSLVHSSTLVVAGVYILLQFRYCLSEIIVVLKYIRFLSLLLRSFGLLNEADIKKLIAYSTINHVSLIIYIMSFGLYKVVYFHLNIHAIFKSLIFICFGFVILSSFHSQDNRVVSYYFLNPIVKIIYYFSCLCLGGLPILRAFFSKDLIIEKIMELHIDFFFVIFFLLVLSLRVYYSSKLLFLYKIIFSFSFFEKSYLSIFRIFLMLVIIIAIVNVYISLIFSLSLEILSNKIWVYIFVLIFIFLRLMIKFNYKIQIYDLLVNFKEVWMVDFYLFDKFMFWNIFSIMSYVSILRKIKVILLINWWVLILVMVFF